MNVSKFLKWITSQLRRGSAEASAEPIELPQTIRIIANNEREQYLADFLMDYYARAIQGRRGADVVQLVNSRNVGRVWKTILKKEGAPKPIVAEVDNQYNHLHGNFTYSSFP